MSAAPQGDGSAAPAATRPRRILIIFNPAAGRARRSARRLERVVAALEARGCPVVIRPTRGAGDAERLARDAEPEFDLIVAAGGDGTANAVATGILGSDRPMAILPLGTANVLAIEIGLRRAPRSLAAVIAGAPARPVWPGRIGDRLFLVMAGSGFDAAVVASVVPDLKRRVGKLAFAWAILVCLCRYRPHELTVGIDGAERRAASAIVAKGRCYAGRFVLAPAARIAEPLFQVVLFEGAGRLAVLRNLAALALGILHRQPGVAISPARTVSLAMAVPGAAAERVHTDGELAAALPVSIALAETPLWLVQPEAAARGGGQSRS